MRRFEYRLFGIFWLQSRIEVTGKPTQYRWLGPLVRVTDCGDWAIEDDTETHDSSMTEGF